MDALAQRLLSLIDMTPKLAVKIILTLTLILSCWDYYEAVIADKSVISWVAQSIYFLVCFAVSVLFIEVLLVMWRSVSNAISKRAKEVEKRAEQESEISRFKQKIEVIVPALEGYKYKILRDIFESEAGYLQYHNYHASGIGHLEYHHLIIREVNIDIAGNVSTYSLHPLVREYLERKQSVEQN